MPARRRRRDELHKADGAVAAVAVLDALLEHVDGAALIVSADGRLLHANDPGRALFRDAHAEIIEHIQTGTGTRYEVTAIAASSVYLVIERAAPALPRDEAIHRAAEAFALSPRQRDVLRAMLQGKSNKEIAVELDIAIPTVETHVTSILRRAGCASRGELAARVWNATAKR